jgi:hypothetical protein
VIKRLASLALFMGLSAAFGQDGNAVNPSGGPPPTAWTQRLYYDGDDRLEYICYAEGTQSRYTFRVSSSTLTDIVDSSNTGTVTAPNHGLTVGNLVTVEGATDSDLDGTYSVQSVVDANTFTITTANVTDATYDGSTLRIYTTAPRTSDAVWAIERLVYNVDGLLTHHQWSSGSTRKTNHVCDNRATSTGASKVTYQ